MPKSSARTEGARATITSKGQVTVPKAIREELGLKSGTKAHFLIDPTGRLVATPLTVRIKDLIGFLPKPERALTVEDINEDVADAAADAATRGL